MINKRGIEKKLMISAVVIAKNEQDVISDCIRSLLWCDEVLLIDNNSNDKTGILAKKEGAEVIGCNSTGYSSLRNFGLMRAKGEWILYVDADERVESGLQHEIFKLLKNRTIDSSVFAIPRKNYVFNRWLKHGGWYPDYVKRLYKKDKLEKWVGDLHEEPEYLGEMGYLKNHLVHLKEKNLQEMVVKTNIRSEIEAQLMFEANHPQMNIVRFGSAMFREFWYRFVKNLAFLDGGEGIIMGIYQVYSRFISYAKLWELQIKNTNQPMDTNNTNTY